MTEEQLTALIEKYLEGTATAAERAIVEEWYAAFDANQATFYAGDPDKLAASAQQSFEGIRRKLSAKTIVTPLTPRKRMAWSRIAAGIALFLSAGAGAWYLIGRQQETPLRIVQNAEGKIQRLTLPDSSVVWLNARSEIQYRPGFSAATREVFLKGEAFFDIHKESKRPFIVHTQGITTQVLGTSFNINAWPELDTMAITLVTGKVTVSSEKRVLAILEPDQQLSYHRKTGSTVSRHVVPGSLIAWKQGKLQFDDCSMAQIASTLERWYGYKIIFEQEPLKKCRYTASFENNIPLKELLEILRQVSNVQYQLDTLNKSVTFKGKDCNN